MSDTLTPEKAQRMIASAPFIDPPTAAADVRDLALAYIDQEQTIAGLRARLDAAEQEREKLAALLHQYQYPDKHLQGTGADCNFALGKVDQEPR